MSTNSTSKILVKYLKKLPKANLDEFIKSFCRLQAPPGCKQIQMKDIEGKAPMELVEIILNSYTMRYGPAKVKQTLKDINANQIRLALEKDLKGASQTDGGQVGGADQKPNLGAGTSSKSVESQKPGEDVKPKGAKTPKTAPHMDGGQVGAADQKLNVGAGTSSKPLKSQKSVGDMKPKGERKPQTESKSSETPTVKAKTSGGAASRKRVGEEGGGKDVKPKKAKKQPTETMAVSPKERILSIFEELGKDDFKKFKAFLGDEEFLKNYGFIAVPLTYLENKDNVDVTDRLIRQYSDEVLKVVKIVLEKIKQKELAKRL